MSPIRVSRHRLSECPGCHAHITVDDAVAQTVCPFCGTQLTQGPDVSSRGLSRLLGRGSKSSLLAASLLGALTVTACEDDGGTSNAGQDTNQTDSGTVGDTTADAASDVSGATDDTGVVPLYGAPADVENDSQPLPDAPVAMYGQPPADVFQTEDSLDASLYGLPPDIEQPNPDTSSPEDIAVVPMYGMPADIEEPGPDIEEAPDSLPQPKYGGPPIDAQ
jgi:predicted RNA-binding Zn-ribbon protein involved in translation (DUF1610 family)